NFARDTGLADTTSVDLGFYSRMLGTARSGWRPSAGRGRICPGDCGCSNAQPRRDGAIASNKMAAPQMQPRPIVNFVDGMLFDAPITYFAAFRSTALSTCGGAPFF